MNKSNNKVMNIIYFSAFGLIFIGLLIFVLVSIFKPFDYKKLEKLKETTVEECLNENKNAKGTQSDYYLLVLEKDSLMNENIKGQVLEYANYVKHHKNSDAKPIYVVYYEEAKLEQFKTVSSKIESSANIPMMFLVKEGKASSTYETCSKINTTLESVLADLEKDK